MTGGLKLGGYTLIKVKSDLIEEDTGLLSIVWYFTPTTLIKGRYLGLGYILILSESDRH